MADFQIFINIKNITKGVYLLIFIPQNFISTKEGVLIDSSILGQSWWKITFSGNQQH